MNPITREEMFLAAAAGEYDGDLPDPKTRLEYYLKKIKEAVENGSSVAPEDIDAAIETYLNSHDADIVTEQELSDALAGYYNKTAIDNALSGKADAVDIPDVSSFIDADVDNLANYYDKDAVDTVLNEKQDTLTAGDNITIETINGELTISATDTTYSDATQQTHGLMSTADKAKLDGITAEKIQAWDAAEQNVNADWTAESGDAQILNKPDLTVYALANDMTTALAGKVDKETGKSLMTADEHTKLNGIETGAQVNTVTGVKGNAENDYRTGDINISPANIGLGNVDNTSDANKPISTATQAALDRKQSTLIFDNAPAANSDNPVKSSGVYSALAGKISTSAKGAAGGVAELDANGKVPSSQLPSYVDNVVEYPTLSDFPATGESGKIYIALNTNLTYRWGGSDYAEISPSIALGTTDSTAYRGDWGAADRAAIGTLTDLQTTAKSNLVSAVNEVKTALGNVQGTLTFDNVPTSGSGNPVKSGGIYTALAGKQDTLTIDSAPTSGSENPVESGGVYTALLGKQDTLIFDSTPTQNSIKPVTSGGIYSALADKVDAEPNKGLISDSERTKLSGITAGATATSVTQTLSSGTKIGTVTVNGVGTDLYCETNTDTTYSAGTGLSLSGSTINHSNSITAGMAKGSDTKTLSFGGTFAIPSVKYDAQGHITEAGTTTMTMPNNPNTNTTYTIESSGADNVGKGQFKVIPSVGNPYIVSINGLQTAAYKTVGTGNDQVAAGDHNHDGTYAPASHSHTKSQITDLANATSSAAGLMSATDKGKLDDSNAGRCIQLVPNDTVTGRWDMVVSGDLNTKAMLTNFTAIEIRYQAFSETINDQPIVYCKTARAVRTGTSSANYSFGRIPLEVYSYSSNSNTLNLSLCGVSVSGSLIKLDPSANGASHLYIYQVYGYK